MTMQPLVLKLERFEPTNRVVAPGIDESHDDNMGERQ
jgi:hypothetical protein